MESQQVLEFLETQYQSSCNNRSDINEHLKILKELSDEVNHVTEMGVRTGNSTRAFLNSDVILRSYDIQMCESVQQLFKIAQEVGKDVQYIQANTLDLTIEETDFLFIDTLHNYDQLLAELRLHAPKTRKYIAFHDTQTFGVLPEGKSPTNLGLLPALIQYMIESNDQWKFKIHRTNNNGLTVIERRNPLDSFA